MGQLGVLQVDLDAIGLFKREDIIEFPGFVAQGHQYHTGQQWVLRGFCVGCGWLFAHVYIISQRQEEFARITLERI